METRELAIEANSRVISSLFSEDLSPACRCFLPTASCRLPTFYWAVSTGSPAVLHASKPPSSAAAFSIPLVLRLITAPALVCSAGQEQYVTIILSRGNSLMRLRNSVVGMSLAPLI
jgi:hypothetical protein